MYYQKIICLFTLLICTVLAQEKTQQDQQNEPNQSTISNDNNDNSTDPSTVSTIIPQILIKNEHDFCLFLPPKQGDNVALTEDDGIPFCMSSKNLPEGAKKFPKDFITTAHYYKTESYEQVTGYFNRKSYQLNKTDGGGQYDSHAKHKPVGAICQGYDYFVSLIEPSNNRFCLRCCNNKEDCPTGRSAYGCKRVVIPGNYDNTDTFDHVAPPPLPTTTTTTIQTTPTPTPTPTDSNSSPSIVSTTTGIQPTESATTTTTSSIPISTPPNDQPGDESNNENTGTNPPSKDDQTTDDSSQTDNQPTDNQPTDNQPTDTNSPSNTNDEPVNNDTQPSNFVVKNHSKRSIIKNQVRYLKRQLNQPEVNIMDVRSQFSSILKNYSYMKPQLKKRLEKLNGHVHSFTTIDQWKDFMNTKK